MSAALSFSCIFPRTIQRETLTNLDHIAITSEAASAGSNYIMIWVGENPAGALYAHGFRNVTEVWRWIRCLRISANVAEEDQPQLDVCGQFDHKDAPHCILTEAELNPAEWVPRDNHDKARDALAYMSSLFAAPFHPRTGLAEYGKARSLRMT